MTVNLKNNKQIKSKKRVAKYAEVFTADREVNAMLDLVDNEVTNIKSTVLEPACGEGAFILKVFERKMDSIKQHRWNGWAKEYNTLQALSSIYGVDIQPDNVRICRNNLKKLVYSYFKGYSRGFQQSVELILSKNIVCGNTLTAEAMNKKPLAFYEWFFDADGEISCRQYKYIELLENGGESNRNHRITRYNYMVKNKPYEDIEAVYA